MVVGVVVFVLLVYYYYYYLAAPLLLAVVLLMEILVRTSELIAIARETMMIISVNAVVRSIMDLLLSLLLFEVLLFA